MLARTKTAKSIALGWLVVGGLSAVVLLALGGCTRRMSSDEDEATQSGDITQTQTVSIPVEGMSCAACAASVKRTAESLDGVRDAEVDLAKRRARIEYIERKISPEQIAAAIEELGYKPGNPVEE